ncbi:MAG: carbohydrate kinase family protein [Ardenticatenaceae bacterium]|nr:carbohydrate kinase family protein [Anaerolineales bacterium]MCB8938906.1 carbohydrate kinase family protein [Ardenticatenaceae bacterium]MCB8974662.1 carbohydrate kinase family protein [Ardenticatenaceae bacterium]
MKKFLVCGHTNIETTLAIDAFPIEYSPMRYPFFGIQTAVAGVGYNITKALATLGTPVNFLTLVGEDFFGEQVRQQAKTNGLADDFIVAGMPQTAQSVILYDKQGKRQGHTDLKDVQERPYPPELFQQALQESDWAILANINWTRPFLAKAQNAGIPIATDVHTITALDDDYNRDYMAAATILFMSDERLPLPPEQWAKKVQNEFGTEIVVIGLGAKGALLAVKSDNFCERLPAVQTRPIVNTIGAGDSLFASFNHFYGKTGDPYAALQKAILFASYKIGSDGAAAGFLTEAALESIEVKSAK